jgi:hypothetical protein
MICASKAIVSVPGANAEISRLTRWRREVIGWDRVESFVLWRH